MIISPLLRERRERPTLREELGRRVLMAVFRETSIKRIMPAAHCVCKEKKRGGGVKKKKKRRKNLSKQTLGSHGYCQRSRDVKRSREQHKGRDKTAGSPFPCWPFCCLRRGGIAPLHLLQVVAPRRRGRELGAPLRPQGSFQLVKMPACSSCGKGSLSVAVDRDLNPGTLKLTVGGKSSRA